MAGSIQLLWYVFVLSSWCLTIFCLETKDYIYAAYPTTLIADTDFPITFGATFNTSEQEILVTVTVSSANVSFSKDLTKEASKEQIILRVKDEFIKTASISLLASVDGFQVAKLSLGGSSKHISRSDGFTVLVQTDKGIYKAGQTVQFRIMGITNDRVVTVKPMTIEIFDSERNRLRRWQNVSDNSGVYIGRMEMSNYPVLGLWSIKVTVEEKSWSKTFEVNEFVLPKFEVLMNFPKVVSIREDEIVAGKVAARYTFGTAVIGTAVVKMKYSSRTLFQREYQLENGEATVEVNMTALTSGMYSSSRAVSIQVTFEEELTSESILQTSSLTIYRYNAKLLLDSMLSTNHFLQGEDIKAELDVVNRDGTEYEGLASEKFVVNVEIDIEFKPGHEYVSLTKRTNITIDTNNHVTFVFENIYHNVSFFKFVYQMKNINATGAGLSTIYKYVRYYGSQSGHYIFIKRLTQPDTYKVGELAKFTIEATRPTPIDVQLQILSKGKIDSEETVALSNTETYNYTVVVTEDLVPKFNILAWYFDEKNVSFIADAIQTKVISVEKDEKVAIRFNKEIVKPGEDIAVEMTSNPRSNLYVLAVDKSVLLLSKGNDITKAMLPKTVDPMANLIPRYGSTYNKDLYTAGLRLTYRALEFPTVSTPAATSTAIREESTSTTSVYIPGTSSSSSAEYVPTSAASSSVYAPSSSQQQPRPRTTSQSQGAKYLSKTNVDDFDTGASPVKQETTRTLFPDTWLFDNVTSSEMGKATIKTIVPDTITTWVASCFSVSSSSFLSVATSPAQVTVFMPFFVSLQLPFSVIRGEQVVLQANVFNYHKDDIYVLVSLKDNWIFRSLASVKRGKNFSIEETCGRADHCIFAKAGKATPAFFPIVPNIIGEIQIEITADSSLFKDTVKKKLRVEAEGLQKSIAYPIMIDLTNSTAFDATVKYEFPPNTVDGSQRMRVDVAGDIMGPTIDGLESLVKMPYGCGEQNMISLSPSVFVSKYLTAINGLSSDLKKRAEGFITTGIQKQLRYKHSDGSFSIWGGSGTGSTWLTSFVVKVFSLATSFVEIDDSLLTRSIQWLLRIQNSVGSFTEQGRVSSRTMQGGSAGSTERMTAYVLISLLEAQLVIDKLDLTKSQTNDLRQGIKEATTYLEGRVANQTSRYTISIVTYALTFAKSKYAEKALKKLESMATESTNTRHWELAKQPPVSKYHYGPTTKAVSIEMTAYALLTYALNRDKINGLRVQRWLVAQRNPYGGFISTQDTVIGLQALSEIAVLNRQTDPQIQLTMSYFDDERKKKKFKITPKNALVVQRTEISTDTTEVSVYAHGKKGSMALMTISLFYNINIDIDDQSLRLNISVINETTDQFTVQSCASWLVKGEKSGMIVVEIGVPSGFKADLNSISKSNLLKRTELGDKMVVLYYDEVTLTKVCDTITMTRDNMVAKLKPVPCRAYEYYEPSNEVTVFYTPMLAKHSNICDLCGRDCGCQGNKDTLWFPKKWCKNKYKDSA